MDYAQEYIDYLVHFHATRDYFECHELLEAYWKSRPKDDPLGDTWVGLIQLAVAQYHHRRGNLAGTRKMLLQAAARLKQRRLDELGLDGRAALQRVNGYLNALLESERAGSAAPYADLELPLADPALLEACRTRSAALGARWGSVSDLGDGDLIHRHTRRDRSGVAEARAASLAAKIKKQD